ncbi:NYN domain-containing protein [Suillus placidus]|uniref:NYN domain-containing protein n=1 Tax=Suillus placidus TaxID=48579 RepID=A0A9P6ZXH1_9AGAM|nr:NYN domain-containing protein [Suillus placidus]
MSHHRKVAIFWDYENCSPPLYSQGHAIVNGIRRIAHVFGYVTSFKAYLDISSQSPKSVGFRSDLQSSGVSMTDCPHSGRKDVVDKMILVDMLAFANDHPSPATIILIAGDRDYAYAVSTLRLRQYNVVLIVPPAPNIPQSLESQASVVVDWNFAILGKRTEADTSPNSAPAAVPLSQPIDIDPTSAMLDNRIVMSDKAAVKDALGYSNRDGDHNSSTDKLTNVSISSPLSTKVDDPSHAQVANSAESYHTTGDAYIVNSALVNDSPPTPEHSVIPISSTSSSAPSPSTPSTPLTPSSLTPSSLTPSSSSIASNSEIGSQQATSVITDNKDKSSGCQAPLIDSESVEDKIRRLTPQKFLPLINQLLLARSKGILNLPRSDIANDLVRVDKDVYKRVGATKFADYALLAKEASIIEFGGGTTRSNSWITLHPRFRQELDAPKSSTPSTNHNDNPPTPQNNISVVPIPPCFQPLVTSLSKIHKSGLAKPFPSTVGLIIGPEIYSKSGASSLTEYFGQAVDAGVVQCGGNSGHAWVSLHPDVLSGKRSC